VPAAIRRPPYSIYSAGDASLVCAVLSFSLRISFDVLPFLCERLLWLGVASAMLRASSGIALILLHSPVAVSDWPGASLPCQKIVGFTRGKNHHTNTNHRHETVATRFGSSLQRQQTDLSARPRETARENRFPRGPGARDRGRW